jgi:hypothetical protein
MSAAHVSSSFLHRPLSGLRAAVFLQDPVSVPPSCTPARVGRPQAITSPEPVPPRSASHHRSRRRRDRAADVEPARAVNLWLSLRTVMFSPRRCVHGRSSWEPSPASPCRVTAPCLAFCRAPWAGPPFPPILSDTTPRTTCAQDHLRHKGSRGRQVERTPEEFREQIPDFIITTRHLFGL